MTNSFIINAEAGKRIANARSSKNWTQSEAAQRLGLALNRTYSLRQYQKLEKGEFPKFKKLVVSELDKVLGTDIYEQIYERHVQQDPSRDELGPKYREMLWFGKVAPNEENYFPLVPHKARAGYSRNYENVDYLQENFEYYPMPPGISPKGADWRWFEVGGESMLPVLNEGDFLLCSLVPHADWVDMLKPSSEGFKVFVVVWKNDVSVKRTVYDKGDFVLIAENESEEEQKRVPLSDVKELWKVRRRITAQLPPTKRFKIMV